MDGIGRRPTGARVVAIVFQTGKNAVSLCVFRHDVLAVCYRVNDRTPGGVLDLARQEGGLDVSDLHAVKDMPKWAQRILFKTIGWQFNWTMHGWALVKKAARAETEAA